MNIFLHEQIQPDSYSKEIEHLKSGNPLPRIRKMSQLDPFLIHLEFYVLVED